MTIVATPQPDAVPPRVQLFVTSGATTLTVTRTDSINVAATVRLCESVPISGSLLVYDYEMPFGQALVYTSQETTGVTTSSFVAAPVQLDVDEPWLIYPGIPASSRVITISAVGDFVRSVAQGIMRPSGRENAVIISDRRGSVASSLSLFASDLDMRDDLLAVLSLGQVLLLNVSPALGWDVPYCYIAPGEVTESRPARVLQNPARLITFPFVVTDCPVGLDQRSYLWGDLLVGAADWRTVRTKYNSWQAVLAQIEYF